LDPSGRENLPKLEILHMNGTDDGKHIRWSQKVKNCTFSLWSTEMKTVLKNN
jgi:hypothetical protein